MTLGAWAHGSAAAEGQLTQPNNPAATATQLPNFQLAKQALQQARRRELLHKRELREQRERAQTNNPRAIGQLLAAQDGWTGAEWQCLNALWTRESDWEPTASNPASGAYGIPQALPGSKMESAGPDWQTNPATQIIWGLNYIKDTYGTPCAALAHSNATGYY